MYKVVHIARILVKFSESKTIYLPYGWFKGITIEVSNHINLLFSDVSIAIISLINIVLFVLGSLYTLISDIVRIEFNSDLSISSIIQLNIGFNLIYFLRVYVKLAHHLLFYFVVYCIHANIPS